MVRFFYVALLALSTVLFADSSARAQQIPDDLLLQFQKRLQSEESDSSNLLPYPQQLENTQPQSREPFSTSDRTTPSFPKSAIEIYYNDRVKDFIEKEKSDENKKSPYINQIGYDILQKSGRLGSRTSIGPQLMGQISDSYILGVGDQLSITLRGQVNNTYQAVVGRDGHVIIPNQPPLQALGRSFGDFRTDLQSLVSTSMLETQAFVTLKAVRQISVLVSGEVTKPGMVSVNGLSTVIDALIAAEGIRKTGTLRKIQIVRGNETQTLDLYPLLLGIGQAGDISLREGDRIIVPTIGSTIALFSGVSRPGIYEFTGTSISLKSALALAGGPLSSRGVTLIKVSQGSNGLLSLNEYSVTAQINLHRGDLIGSKPVSKRTQGTIYLSGHVYEEGWRPLSTFSSLRTLLNTRGTLREEPYLPVVVIKRPNVNTLMPEFIAVDGAKLLKRGDDFLLQDQDRVIILSLTDIRYLSSEDISLVLQGKMPAYGRTEDLSEALREKSPDDYNSGESEYERENGQADGEQENDSRKKEQEIAQQGRGILVDQRAIASMKVCKGLKTLVHLVDQNGLNSYPFSDNQSKLKDIQVCPKLYDTYPNLLPFLFQNMISLDGAIYRPGYYPIIDGGYLSDVIVAAGGPLQNADPNKVEVTLPRNGSVTRQEVSLALAMADYAVTPGANVRIGRRFSDIDGGMMTVSGEVRYPGRYRLLRGERLSQLIERAGGYTDEAYVLGAVFMRESIRKQEEASYKRLADEMEQGLPSAVDGTSVSTDPGQKAAFVSALQQAIRSLRTAKAAGRMVVDATAASLQGNPENDILLQSGDMLHIPRRPSHIMVSGEVMHAGALRFIPGQSADAYIEQAGGMREAADETRIFVVLPDGSAKPITVSSWNYKEIQLPPGSTIVVPRDLSPISWWGYARDTLSIFSNVAISAAALASIND